MSKTVRAQVTPTILSWAREDAGFSVETTAKKAGVRPEQVQKWEQGESKPTMNQLRKLAWAYRRPLAVFFLPEPPEGFQPLHDFRRLPGEVADVYSPALRYHIRRARTRRKTAIELYQLAQESPPSFKLAGSLQEGPASLAQKMRDYVGVPLAEQLSWEQGYQTFRLWRAALERAGVLIFEATDIEPDQMRAFSIVERPLPAIVLNMKDALNARVFSLFHELAHIVLNQEALCDILEEAERPAEEQRIEVYCNTVAAEFLVPREALLEQPVVRQIGSTEQWSDDSIDRLAKKFGVSREVIVRRLLECGRTNRRFYEKKRADYQREYERREREKKDKGGFAPPHLMAFNESGPTFSRLVVENYENRRITAGDLCEYLGVRLKHLDGIRAEVQQKNLEAEAHL